MSGNEYQINQEKLRIAQAELAAAKAGGKFVPATPTARNKSDIEKAVFHNAARSVQKQVTGRGFFFDEAAAFKPVSEETAKAIMADFHKGKAFAGIPAVNWFEAHKGAVKVIKKLEGKHQRATKHIAILTADNDRLEELESIYKNKTKALRQEVNALLPADKPRYVVPESQGEMSINGVKIGQVIGWTFDSESSGPVGIDIDHPELLDAYQAVSEDFETLTQKHDAREAEWLAKDMAWRDMHAKEVNLRVAAEQGFQQANDEMQGLQKRVKELQYTLSNTSYYDALKERDSLRVAHKATLNSLNQWKARWVDERKLHTDVANQLQAANKEIEALNTLAVSRVDHETLQRIQNDTSDRLGEFRDKWLESKTLAKDLGAHLYKIADILLLPKNENNTYSSTVLFQCADKVTDLRNKYLRANDALTTIKCAVTRAENKVPKADES